LSASLPALLCRTGYAKAMKAGSEYKTAQEAVSKGMNSLLKFHNFILLSLIWQLFFVK
jgi:hypothetical protein